jgi:hypothetical protein
VPQREQPHNAPAAEHAQRDTAQRLDAELAIQPFFTAALAIAATVAISTGIVCLQELRALFIRICERSIGSTARGLRRTRIARCRAARRRR